MSIWVFPYILVPVTLLFYLSESNFLIYLSLKFVIFNRTFSLRDCVPKHWSHEGVYVISSCILRFKDLHEAVCLYPLPPGGPCSSREGVQPVLCRSGGAPATWAEALSSSQQDHGLPGDPDHGPKGRQPSGLVRLRVEPHTGYTEGISSLQSHD